MASAVWCWEAAQERAFHSRQAALIAAQRGDRDEAIRLANDAQRHDRIAADWQPRVPQWQWDLYWDLQRNEQRQHDTWR
jgi:hypothetical protein